MDFKVGNVVVQGEYKKSNVDALVSYQKAFMEKQKEGKGEDANA